ncbi:MAG: cob(I)yrinic acid a,c-diamide adenosyltransferase [Nitrospira sp.]|nr:cob(I)yrinic acid a,c-diamide adenosyltransferase [Nitrospira sp.]
MLNTEYEQKTTVFEPKKKVGLVVVITGDGKGKTTAALGMALRAAGYNMKVCIIQFIKGDMYSGEIDGIKRLAPNIELHVTGKGFCGIMGDRYSHEEHRENAQNAIRLARDKTSSGEYDLIILDEINNALKLGLVDLSQITELIDIKPHNVHLVLTGRDAHPDVIKRAHTVTEMKEVKHALSQGIEPQKGIDY